MEVLAGQLHAFCKVGGVLEPSSVQEEVVGKDAWNNRVAPHLQYPWPHEECYEGHGEWASLWDGTPVLVFGAEGVADLIPDCELLLKGFVSEEHLCRHAGCACQCDDQRSDNLVKALVDIDAACGDCSPGSLFEFKLQLGQVPGFFSTCPGDACKHGRIGPCLDPCLHVLQAYGSPKPIHHRGEFEYPVGHGVPEVCKVFAEEDCSG